MVLHLASEINELLKDVGGIFNYIQVWWLNLDINWILRVLRHKFD